MTVTEATEVTDELVEAFARLIPQLSSSSPPPGRAELAEMVGSAASIVLMARDGSGALVGSLTLALFRVPTGLRAWIEDVVVDASARGAGAGEALVLAAVERAEAARGPDRRPDLAAQSRGGQPTLRTDGFRAAHHQRVPAQPGTLSVAPDDRVPGYVDGRPSPTGPERAPATRVPTVMSRPPIPARSLAVKTRPPRGGRGTA